jgi:hypothetical protein
MPRTLNPALANFIRTQDNGTNNRNFRLSHQGDIVPNSIPTTNRLFPGLTFQHITPSYFITTNNVQIPTARDVTVIPDDIEVPLNFPDTVFNFLNPANVQNLADSHRFYINSISACTASIIVPPVTVAAYLVDEGFPGSPAGIPSR